MYNRHCGDDRSRRERLAPDCEPRGAVTRVDIVHENQRKTQVPTALTTLLCTSLHKRVCIQLAL